jgi:hypothetical protein
LADYTKLSALVDKSFTVEKVHGSNWKKWDTDQNKMLSASEWQEGYSKKWQVTTDQGDLDLSPSQIGQMLERALDTKGVAELVGKSFAVKSNGKTGMEIRYFLNIDYKYKSDGETLSDLPDEKDTADELAAFFNE